MNQPLLFAFLITLAVFVFFLGVWRLVAQRGAVDNRLHHYGKHAQMVETMDKPRATRPALTLVGRLLQRVGLGPALTKALVQADLPMTTAEYGAIMLALAVVGYLLGALRVNLLIGLLAAFVFGALPMLYLRIVQMRRQRAFANQLPDVLTLLVGALRAGYGLNQAITVLIDQLPAPSATEFGRIQRAVNLGMPLQRALSDRAALLDNDDLDLMVTAINVQYEIGGNLAQVLDTIGETIRERIRIMREVRVLTAQQRLSGYVIAAVPLGLTVFISLTQPHYFDPFFEPGPAQFLPYLGGGLLLAGFWLIRRIVDIKV